MFQAPVHQREVRQLIVHEDVQLALKASNLISFSFFSSTTGSFSEAPTAPEESFCSDVNGASGMDVVVVLDAAVEALLSDSFNMLSELSIHLAYSETCFAAASAGSCFLGSAGDVGALALPASEGASDGCAASAATALLGASEPVRELWEAGSWCESITVPTSCRRRNSCISNCCDSNRFCSS
eukprot:CAMPEP_0115479170 /NCGR_PEP_ID=MMETSP0271-20121206/56594_1 /TAXON_ID=71861 /ORGANISM="Scrippsiella trochoidea, Strain CCMP3099" /LENGTH=182 /DNA_ID=CAMNT_0002906765 /DNA_START=31 /DNA_END=575 /DNA_ORIENTATION=-